MFKQFRAVVCTFLILVFILILNVHSVKSNRNVAKLGELGMKVKIYTVSGFSAGGSMASQLYLAYSNLIRGVAIFSGVLYHCGEGPDREVQKLLQCTRGSTNLNNTIRKVQELSNFGLLDPLQNLAYRRHYVEQGQLDVVVRPRAAQVIQRFFSYFSDNVRFIELPHAHATPTVCNSRCTRRLAALTGLVNCGYSATYDALNYLYKGRLVHPGDSKTMKCSQQGSDPNGLIEFNQTEFFPSGRPSVGMAAKGLIYIPQLCRQNATQCRLHVHFHGCMTDQMMQGRQYVQNTELMAIADANDLIILFPQATFAPQSVTGLLQCWDMIGFTDPNNEYYWGTKRGRQLSVIYRMIERILGEEINQIEYAIYNNQLI